jgi:hypothetical protein
MIDGTNNSKNSTVGVSENLRYIIENITKFDRMVQAIKEKIFINIEKEQRPKDWRA